MVWIRSRGPVRYVVRNTRPRLSETNMTKEKMDYETAYKELKKEIEGLTKPKTLSERIERIKDIIDETMNKYIWGASIKPVPFYYKAVTVCSFILVSCIFSSVLGLAILLIVITKGLILIPLILFSSIYLWIKSGSTD